MVLESVSSSELLAGASQSSNCTSNPSSTCSGASKPKFAFIDSIMFLKCAFLAEWQQQMTFMMSTINGKVGEISRTQRAILDVIAKNGFNPMANSANPINTAFRARLPCHSKHALRALDNDLGCDEALYRDIVRNFNTKC